MQSQDYAQGIKEVKKARKGFFFMILCFLLMGA